MTSSEVIGHDSLGRAVAPTQKRCKILLVEDNPLEARLFQRALTDVWSRTRVNYKFEIVHAERLDRACQMLDTHRVDIILLDISLPDANGPENIDRIRHAAKHTPIILMTGLDDASIIAEAIRRGAHDCLVKSRLDGAHIARTIGHAVERHQLQSEIARQADTLTRRETNLQNMITASRDGMVIIDQDDLICFVNETTETLLGKTEADLIGQPFNFPISTEGTVEIDIIRGERNLTLEMVTTEIEWENQPSRLVSLRDVSDRKQLINDKLLLERRLLESQRLESLGIMASSIVHDFNNLLTAILGSAGAARMESPASSPLQEDLREIENSCQRAADICKQMLAYSGSKAAFTVDPVDLNALVTETSALLHHSISKRATVKHNLESTGTAVLGDETQLRQIIMNLVINASEAIGTKNGNVQITTTSIEFTESNLPPEFKSGPTILQAGRYACLEVADNGCGIPADVQKKIFDPFFSTKNSGRGVGLCAVAQIVKKHKGAITVHSQPNIGTTFRVYIPCVAGRRQSAPATPTAPNTWQGEGTVLIVDDEKGVRTAIARILKHLGFQTIIASDGRDGITKFRQYADKITCVLMDLTMPQLDGQEACAEILRLRPGTPVVLMSGFNEEEACRRFGQKGPIGFLQKPFDHAKLQRMFRSIIEQRAAA